MIRFILRLTYSWPISPIQQDDEFGLSTCPQEHEIARKLVSYIIKNAVYEIRCNKHRVNIVYIDQKTIKIEISNYKANKRSIYLYIYTTQRQFIY